MAEEEKDQEPQQIPNAVKDVPRKRPRALDQANRILTEEELGHSGVRKMMLDELERLKEENAELSGYRAQYFDSVTECAILKQKEKISIAGEVISFGCSAIGGALIGLSSMIFADKFYAGVLIAIGFLLLGIAGAAKLKMR